MSTAAGGPFTDYTNLGKMGGKALNTNFLKICPNTCYIKYNNN